MNTIVSTWALQCAVRRVTALCAMMTIAFACHAQSPVNTTDSPDAPIVIVTFSAFSCPYCAEGSKMLDGLQAKYPGRIHVVFKHFPLGADNAAYLPHEAALAAGEQGKFREMHDALYAHQADASDRTKIGVIATKLNLDMGRFNTALDRHSETARIKADVADAGAFKVTATPTFFIDGYKFEGLHQASVFEQIIEHKLARLNETNKPPLKSLINASQAQSASPLIDRLLNKTESQ